MSQTGETVVESVSKGLRAVWWIPLLRGLILLVLGVLVLVEPLNTLQILAKIMGVFLLIDALVSILHGWANRKQTGWRVWLIQGVIDLAFAALILFWPAITATVFFYLLVIWAIALGAMAIIGAVILAKTKSLTWPWLLAFGLVSMLFGVMLLLKGGGGDGKTVEVIGLVIGLYAFMAGALQIVSAFAVRSVAHDLDSALHGESEVLQGLNRSGVQYQEQKALRAAERVALKEELERAKEAEARDASNQEDETTTPGPMPAFPVGAPIEPQKSLDPEDAKPLVEDQFGTKPSPDAGAQPVTREQLRNWQAIHQAQQPAEGTDDLTQPPTGSKGTTD